MQTYKFLMITGVMSLMLLSSKVRAAQSIEFQEDVLKPRSTSPFEIARLVNKASRSWKKYQIEVEVDLGSTWKRLRIDPSVYNNCAYCEAAVFKSELDGKPGREVILKLTRSFDSCRYLIFTPEIATRGKIHWKLLGHIDHDFNRYQMAHHRVVRALGRNWFVLRGQEGSGSGYDLYGETWFEVSNSGVRPVLNYSSDGGTDPGIGGLSWQLKGRPYSMEQPGDRQAIRLVFTARYTAKGFEDGSFLRRFIVRRDAIYMWNRKSRQFVFVRRRSTISESEMNAVANAGTEPDDESKGTKIGETAFFSSLKGFVGSGFEMFLRLNVSRLTRIAHGPKNPTKDWLREFIKQCNDIPEKLAVENVLGDQLPRRTKRR